MIDSPAASWARYLSLREAKRRRNPPRGKAGALAGWEIALMSRINPPGTFFSAAARMSSGGALSG
jgi:hypothetical protein